MPRMTVPAGGASPRSGISNPPNDAFPFSIVASTRFIDGDPMNAATNTFFGRW